MDKQLSFLLLFSFLVVFSFSQEKDSLSNKSYVELTGIINKVYAKDLKKGLEVSGYYLKRTQKNNDKEEEFKALSLFIDLSIYNRKFNDFYEEEKRLVALAKQLNFDKQLMKSYFAHANNYFYNGLFGKAIETYYKSYTLAKLLDNLTYQHLNLKQIGYLNYFTGKLDESVKLQKQALKLLDDYNQKRDSVFITTKKKMNLNALKLLTRTYIFANQQDSARIYNQKAFQINLKESDSCHLKSLLMHKAQIYVLDKEYDNAKQYLEKFKQQCYIPNSIDDFLLAYEYGKIHLGLKEYNQAVTVLNQGLEDYNINNQEAFASDYLKLMAKAYKHKGNIEKSNFYFEKFANANEDFGKIKDTIASKVKTQEIKLFKAELEAIKSESNKKGSYLKYLALAASIIILALLFFLLKFYRNKKQNELKFQELLSKFNTSDKKTTIVDTKDEILEESTSSEVNEDIKQQILTGLQKLEDQEYYLKQDCNSYNVAKKIKTNTSYLSKVINAHYQKNFNTYINDLRINYAIIRLKEDGRFRSFSIQSIAEELGYKSADSFTKYFKQHTDLNPSFYIKQLNALA